MAISTLDEYLATIPNGDNRARMVEVLGLAQLPGAGAAHRVEPADVHPPRDVHHRILGGLQAHGDGSKRTTLLMIARGMRNYGTVLRIEVHLS